MEIRKLDVKEHNKTRALWESVFSEDTKAFLDYYYFIKARENEIYAATEEGAVRAMLQLNPYEMQIGAIKRPCNYIVGVATEASCRKKGLMGKLLRMSMQEMYGRKEPFTFLMPAAESIYKPYDFRFVYTQERGSICGKRGTKPIQLSNAYFSDAEEMADFFNRYIAPAHQVYAVRNEAYYQMMLMEQQSENGGVKLCRENGSIVGMFAYAREDVWEIREPIWRQGYEHRFPEAVYELTGNEAEPVTCIAYAHLVGCEEKRPMIMARILHFETLIEAMQVKAGEVLDCSFAVLDPILSKNSRIWRVQGGGKSRGIAIRETEDSQGVLTIGALAELLFGSRTPDEVAAEEDVILTDGLKRELEKIEPLRRVFLNEIV